MKKNNTTSGPVDLSIIYKVGEYSFNCFQLMIIKSIKKNICLFYGEVEKAETEQKGDLERA